MMKKTWMVAGVAAVLIGCFGGGNLVKAAETTVAPGTAVNTTGSVTFAAGDLNLVTKADGGVDLLPSNLNFGSHSIADVNGKGLDVVATNDGKVADGTNETKGTIKVNDMRGSEAGWSVSVKENAQFKSKVASKELTGAALKITVGNITATNGGTVASVGKGVHTLTPGTEEVVLGAKATEGAGTTTAAIEGFSLNIPATTSEVADVYESALVWTLSNTAAK